MSKNKTIIITIVLGLLLAIIAGFVFSYVNLQKDNTTAVEDVNINMTGFTYSLAQLQPIISDYQKTHPHIHINYTQIDESTYKTFLTQRMKGGNTKVIPDIFEAKSTDQNSFIKFTRVASSDIISAKTFKDTYYPVFDRGLIFNNQSVIGLPENIDPLFLIFNQSLLQQQHLDTASITSDIDSFNRITTQLAKTTKLASVNIGATSNRLSDILQLLMIENGTIMNDPANPFKASFNTIQGAEAVEYFQAFANPNGIHKDNWDAQKSEDDIKTFVKGSTAMIFGTLSDIKEIQTIQPSMQLSYGMYPSLNSPVTLASYNYDAVYGYSSNIAPSWNFLLYLHSKPVQQKLLSLIQASDPYGYIPARKDISFASTDKILANTINSASTHAVDWNTEDKDATSQIFKTLVSSYVTGSAGQSALDLAVKQINTNIQKALNL